MLTEEEIRILSEAKESNKHWFHAVCEAGNKMVERRAKYAGQNHPYFNFVDMAYRNDTDMFEVFKNYVNIKVSRLSASNKDFDDERVSDTFLDIGNYGFLALGWMLDNLSQGDVYPWDDFVSEQLRIAGEMQNAEDY